MRYLKGSSDTTIYHGGTNISLHRYVDSNFASDIDGRKGITAYIFKLESRVISWVSRLQKIVVLSTTEAEYVVATKAYKG